MRPSPPCVVGRHCAEHVLPFFESSAPRTSAPALPLPPPGRGQRWAMIGSRPRQSRHGCCTPAESARFAAYAGPGTCVGHVAEHDLGAAAYAIKQPVEHPGQKRISRSVVRAPRLACTPLPLVRDLC